MGIKFDGIVGVMLLIVIIGLLLKDASATSTIINNFAGAWTGVLGTLQVRNVSGPSGWQVSS